MGWGGGGVVQKLEKTTFAKSPERTETRGEKEIFFLGIIIGLPIFSNEIFARVNTIHVVGCDLFTLGGDGGDPFLTQLVCMTFAIGPSVNSKILCSDFIEFFLLNSQ
jgi:hypothetical protein